MRPRRGGADHDITSLLTETTPLFVLLLHEEAPTVKSLFAKFFFFSFYQYHGAQVFLHVPFLDLGDRDRRRSLKQDDQYY